jgi:hypothetical protein
MTKVYFFLSILGLFFLMCMLAACCAFDYLCLKLFGRDPYTNLKFEGVLRRFRIIP